MGYKVTFYSVIDKQTNELIHESRDAYYISRKMGIPYQKIVGCAKAQSALDERYIIYIDDVVDMGFPPDWREWFIKEWYNLQRMFHVKHA